MIIEKVIDSPFWSMKYFLSITVNSMRSFSQKRLSNQRKSKVQRMMTAMKERWSLMKTQLTQRNQMRMIRRKESKTIMQLRIVKMMKQKIKMLKRRKMTRLLLMIMRKRMLR